MSHRTEELASKAMGAFKAAQATIGGLTGVFKTLTQEHGQVTALLMRVKMSSEPRVRRDLFPKIRAELLAHEKGELREVYPAFRQHPELEALAREHDEEARQLERTLEEVGAIPYENEAWSLAFERLVDLVSHHTKEEENDIFPVANRVLGREAADRMRTRYEIAKADVLRQGS